MSDDEFTKLFRYMTERFDKLEAKVDAKADGERVYTLLDGIARRIETDDVERVAMAHQLARHQRWIEQLAQKLKVSLDYQEE